MGFKHSLLTGLAVLTTITQAVQLFSNTGTTSGWSSIQTEHNGQVTQVTNVVGEGTTALKMTQTYDSSYTGRYHSEVHVDNAYSIGDQRFYGFLFRLSSDWQSDPAQGYNLAQFIGDFSAITTCDGWMPSTMIWVVGNQLYTRLKTGSVCSQTTTQISTGVTVTPGEWHKIVVQASWQSNTSGFFKLWYDGTKVVEQYNVATTVAEDIPFQFRVGLYANSWYDEHQMKGTQPFRQVWFDEIAFGTTFADADPSQW
ncbi:polysaccharide lyase [Cercophora scortea]|uniref:Polysaccharide lyase n=1 Tax=Cercophora scortea TaxID=314031 RepID=A0AAE0I278_9PEZI|nr:polysaccharide lyase [Cercophora scortea]